MVEVSEVVLYALIAIETFNLAALAYIMLWTKRAGSRIVEAIALRLGLRTGRAGKNASPLDALQSLVDKVVGNKPETEEAGEKSIEIPGIGTVTESEIQGLAKKYLPQVKKAMKTGEGVEALVPQGGEMDILQKMASGGNVGWADALPWIMQMFKPEAGGQAGQAGQSETRQQSPNDTNRNW